MVYKCFWLLFAYMVNFGPWPGPFNCYALHCTALTLHVIIPSFIRLASWCKYWSLDGDAFPWCSAKVNWSIVWRGHRMWVGCFPGGGPGNRQNQLWSCYCHSWGNVCTHCTCIVKHIKVLQYTQLLNNIHGASIENFDHCCSRYEVCLTWFV